MDDTADARDDALAGWRAVVVAHDTLMQRFSRTFKEHGLTVPQYDVLLRLLQAPEHAVPMGELARTLLYSSGAATKLVDRLVTLGHVTRERSTDDGRVMVVRLTEPGAALALGAARHHATDVTHAVGPFASESEREHVLAYLGRIAADEVEAST